MIDARCSYCHDTGYHLGRRVNGECNYCTSAERRERQKRYVYRGDRMTAPELKGAKCASSARGSRSTVLASRAFGVDVARRSPHESL